MSGKRPPRGKTCSWCDQTITPGGPRMRLHCSEGIRVSGIWLAHFHPKCGDALLDYLERRTAASEGKTTR